LAGFFRAKHVPFVAPSPRRPRRGARSTPRLPLPVGKSCGRRSRWRGRHAPIPTLRSNDFPLAQIRKRVIVDLDPNPAVQLAQLIPNVFEAPPARDEPLAQPLGIRIVEQRRLERRLASLGMLVSRPHRAHLRLELAGLPTQQVSPPSAKLQVEVPRGSLLRKEFYQEADLFIGRSLLGEQVGDAMLRIRPARRGAVGKGSRAGAQGRPDSPATSPPPVRRRWQAPAQKRPE
jgi:hypothetical protein